VAGKKVFKVDRRRPDASLRGFVAFRSVIERTVWISLFDAAPNDDMAYEARAKEEARLEIV
jgi:hypothetical protein